VNGDPREYRERLRSSSPIRALRSNTPRHRAARGTHQAARSSLLPGQSPAEEFATLANEIAHDMMHRAERRSSTSKRIRETEAEGRRICVCGAVGLETGSAAQTTSASMVVDAKLLSESLEYVQGTASQNSQCYRRG